MGMFSRKSNEFNNTTSSGHTGRDAGLGAGAGGALGHHEGNGHTGRDALVGGAVAGEGEHLRNEHHTRNGLAANSTTTHGYATGTTGSGVPESHVGRDAALGAGAGGLTGHHGNGGHGVRDGAIGAGVGAEAAHLHNEHEQKHMHNNNSYGNDNTLGTSHNGAGATTAAGGGMGAGAGTLHHNNATTATPAPASALHANAANGHSKPSVLEADRLAKSGKKQERMGHLFCSSKMEHKGALKIEQAQHIRAQAVEIDEAERLEKEAGMRRERAVGLGADTVHGNATTGINANHGGMHGGNRMVNPV